MKAGADAERPVVDEYEAEGTCARVGRYKCTNDGEFLRPLNGQRRQRAIVTEQERQ